MVAIPITGKMCGYLDNSIFVSASKYHQVLKSNSYSYVAFLFPLRKQNAFMHQLLEDIIRSKLANFWRRNEKFYMSVEVIELFKCFIYFCFIFISVLHAYMSV